MEKRKRRLFLGVFICLLLLFTACKEKPENSAATTTSSETGESPEEVETASAPISLPQVEGEPTYISVSQFPVSVIEAASAQRPAFISIEMAGFDISALTWQIGRYEDDCDRLYGTGKILPEGSESWPDGVHQASFSWPAIGYFLGDSERADFVYVQIGEANRFISGRFRKASSGETVDAKLVVDPLNSQIIGLQSADGQILSAAPGDGFQLSKECLESGSSIRSVSEVELIFPEAGQLKLDRLPLPTGDYFLRLEASSQTNSASSITDFPVNNDSILADYQVYLNTEYGFQFLYPVGWTAPQLQNGLLVTGDPAGATTETITVHPDLGSRAPADLKNLALSQFGQVTVLFEDQISIGDTGTLWTAYGYDGADGPHTGVLLAFARNGVGYTIDMDGLQTAEDQTIQLMNTLAETWLFRPDIIGPRARVWTASLFDALAMPVMATDYQEALENGWRRYTVGDGVSFLAVRTASLSRNNLSDMVRDWQEVVARGTTDFAISDDYSFMLNGREWSRTDFAYKGQGDLGIQGFLMVAEIDRKAVVFWAEMPVNRYQEQSALFLLSLAGLR